MKQYTISKGARSTGSSFKPHFNKKSLTYLVKCKSLNTYQDVIIEQRNTNSLFGLTYGMDSIGFSFNIKDEYMYVYGYHKQGNVDDIVFITKCLIDSWYYLGFEIEKGIIRFTVHTFKRKTKASSSITLNKTLIPFGVYTYPNLNKNYKAPVELNFLMADYTKILNA